MWSNYGGFPTPNLMVRALAVLPNGDVLAGGDFTTPAQFVIRGTAQYWYPGLPPTLLDAPVHTLSVLSSGDVMVGGAFRGNANGSAYHARLVPDCPATASAYGSGCTGAAGTVALTALGAPWLGGTYRARSTGIPSNALVVDVLGLSALATPLASVLPQGLPGCTLLASPDLLTLVVPSAGAAVASLPLPPYALGLIGAQLHQQHVPLEFGAAGLAALSGSNGLLLTLGLY